MNRVLAAIDNSAAAHPVLSAAQALAHVLGADVRAVYVADEQGLTARASAERMQIPFQCLGGDPLEEVVTEANVPGVAAVAIGARRRVGERGVGHLATAVADTIDKPVMVVPPNRPSIERFRTAIVAMEGTRERSREVKATIQVVAESELDLIVLHVDDEASIPSFSDQLAHETEAYAKEFLARHLPGGPAARLELRVGSPTEEIVSAITSLGADLVAIGWPQRRESGRGRNAEEILDRSGVPVLLMALDDRSMAPAKPARPFLPI